MSVDKVNRIARIKAAALTNGLMAYSYAMRIADCPYPFALPELAQFWRTGWLIGLSIAKKRGRDGRWDKPIDLRPLL